MQKLGVVEGFFGPAWPEEKRKSYASFLARYSGGFYIYAPKQDQHLRKGWREPWDESYLSFLGDLKAHFHSHQIKFGIGFSPFGLGEILTSEDELQLHEKLHLMKELGIDIVGLFFDDMPTTENLAKTQITALKVIQKNFPGKIIFCPSYYTPDPILDKVFGARPENYLNEIAEGVPSEVAVAWTGPKVISPEISREHLQEVSLLLKRKPFIWENLFANDGPKNCKFLKLKAYSGRDSDVLTHAEAFAFNLMNQPELSKIVYLAASYVLERREDPAVAWEKALEDLCSPELSAFIRTHQSQLLTLGLDNFTQEEKASSIEKLKHISDPAAQEIIAWFEGDYNVGSECLTD